MPSRPQRIPAPDQGLSDDTSYTKQPPLTTREALNNRAIEARTGRNRHGPRSGLDTYIASDGQLNGTAPVQDIVTISKNEDLLTYALDATPDNVFGLVLPGPSGSNDSGGCVDMRMDDFGDLYVAQRQSGVYKYNQNGILLAEILIPEADSAGRVEIAAIDVDEFGNVLVGTGQDSDGPADCRLYLFVSQLDGTYRLAWTLNPADFSDIDQPQAFLDVGFYQGSIYTLEGDDVPSDWSNDNHYFRVYPNYTTLLAPTPDTTKEANLKTLIDPTVTNSYATRMAIRDDGVVYITGMVEGSTRGWIGKINPNGETPTAFVAAGSWFHDTTSDSVGGLGYGIAIGPKNSDGQYTLYTYGTKGASGSNHCRRIVDDGDAADFSGTDAWSAAIDEPASSADNATTFNRIDTDIDGNLYICQAVTSGNIVEIRSAADGTELGSFDETTADSTNGGTCVAVSKEAKPVGSAEEEVELVFYGTREAATGDLAFFCNRMLTVTQGSGPMRSVVALGVSDGDIVKFSTASASAVTGGTGAIDTSAPFVQSVSYGEFVYFTDGISYLKYSVVDDEVTVWQSETSSLIPPRCRLIESWRGRVVIGRDPEDAQLWHMSAVGNALDWDNFPPVPVVTQAISGVNAKAGKVPDIVNSIIPWDDDLCIFGGDRSIWRLTGDPLAGGQFDLITDETGTAFGRCWTKEPLGGRLFFVGSRGGVYMMERNSLPVRISRDWIERRLQDDVDHSQYFLRLVWNYRDEGLHIFQCPFLGNEGTIVKHWFWDAKNASKKGGGWWEDQFGSTALGTELQPCSVAIIDGDSATDRKVLFGCEDGRVRVWDESRIDDKVVSGTEYPIQWKLVYGPLMPANVDKDFRFRRFTAVLASDQAGCSYKFYGPDHGDTLGAVLYSGSLRPGRNNGSPAVFRASNAFLELANGVQGQRCSVEDLLIHVAPAGRVRRTP